MNLAELVARLGGQFYPSADGSVTDAHDIHRIATLEAAQPEELAFLANPKYKHQLDTTRACAVIIHENMREHLPAHLGAIVSDDPYLYFARALQFLNPPRPASGQRHDSAVIAASARIAEDVEIGAHAVIGENCMIGAGTRILAGAVIQDDCQLGTGCLIHPNVVLYHGTVLGNHVQIHSGSVIGADGFGNAWDKTRREWVKIPQTGAVVIGDHTEIGANSMIDRGALENTVIGRGVRIDNQVQIGHNCVIGDHTAIAACTGISGSTKIGNYCLIGGAAMFVGHIEIADGTIIGGGTAVTRSITEPGHYATCYPLQTQKEWAKNAVHIRHLNDISRRLKALEKALSGSLNPQEETLS